MAAKRDTSFAVRTSGLGALNRSLGRIDSEMRKDSVGHLRKVAREVRDDAKPLTPVKSGALQRSLRYRASNRGAAISSNLPYAGVHEYGGQIAPRGTPIAITPARMLGRAVERNADNIAEQMGDLFDRIAHVNGFR